MNRTQLQAAVGIGDFVRVTDTPADTLTGTILNTNAGVVESTRYIEHLGDDGRLRDRGLSVVLRELETPVGVPQIRVQLWSLDLGLHWQVEPSWRSKVGTSQRPIVID